MDDDGRNQLPGTGHPPHPVTRELISAVVQRIDELRNKFLDDAPPIEARALLAWEEFRHEIDRELRDISLALASACPPV